MNWAIDELGEANLGDQRLTNRLVNLAFDLSQSPEDSIPEACKMQSKTKGAYRFFGNDRIARDQIYEAHRNSTLKRIEDESIVLMVQDTTSFNYNSHKKLNLGPIQGGKNPSAGFFMHTTMAVSTTGTPLGVVAQHFWTRPSEKLKNSHKNRPIAEKESNRWLELLSKSNEDIPVSTRPVMVADRESDIYDLFIQSRQEGHDFLIRAAHNRRLSKSELLSLDAVKSKPRLGKATLTIPKSGNRNESMSKFEIRSGEFDLLPPKHREDEELTSVRVNIIHAMQVDSLPGAKPVEWFLITNLSVYTLKDALKYIKWYTYRWRIERYHYVLKSGCRVEEIQLETFERLQRAIAVYSIVAWRLLWLTYEAREKPEDSCLTALSLSEWEALHIATHKTQVPKNPPTLQEAVRMIARLGGFLGRRSDGWPGVKVLWRGFTALQHMTYMKECMQDAK